MRVRVVGTSMSPTLAPGDRLVVWRWAPVRVGSIVAVGDPRQAHRLLVKRVASVGPAGVEVLGDNEAGSTDSRSFGVVPRSLVAGRAVYRYFPLPTAGLVRTRPTNEQLAPSVERKIGIQMTHHDQDASTDPIEAAAGSRINALMDRLVAVARRNEEGAEPITTYEPSDGPGKAPAWKIGYRDRVSISRRVARGPTLEETLEAWLADYE